MKISPVALCFTTPPLRPVARRLSSSRLYRICRINTAIAMRYNAHRKRFLRPIQIILSDHMSDKRLSEVCRSYLIQRKYLNYLEATWQFMTPDQRPHATFEGAGFLQQALAKNQGAVLISGHNFGFSRLVGPMLAEKGFQISRAGSLTDDIVRHRWGAEAPWEYIYLTKDPWGRVRALRQLTSALKKNRIVHLLVVNRRSGDQKTRVDFFGRDFFLDEGILKLIADLSAPVMPCFALCSGDGTLDIKIHAQLNNTADELSAGFTKLFSWYVKEFPEYVRFWKPLLNQKPHW